jgi:hypothetical protein
MDLASLRVVFDSSQIVPHDLQHLREATGPGHCGKPNPDADAEPGRIAHVTSAYPIGCLKT